MPTGEGFSERLAFAIRLRQLRAGEDLGQTELGRRVGEALGTRAIPQGTVYKWLEKGTIPQIPTVVAIGRVLGVDPGWLLVGDATAAPAPPEWASRITPPGADDFDQLRRGIEATQRKDRPSGETGTG